MFKPRAVFGDMGDVHAPIGGQLIEDHLHPGGAGPWVGHDEDVVRPRHEPQTQSAEAKSAPRGCEPVLNPLQEGGGNGQEVCGRLLESWTAPILWRFGFRWRVRQRRGTRRNKSARGWTQPKTCRLHEASLCRQFQELCQLVHPKWPSEACGEGGADLVTILPAVELFDQKVFFFTKLEGFAGAAIPGQVRPLDPNPPGNQLRM